MKLKYCSMTGADDAVNPQDLLRLSQEFPFVEWAVWLMPERMGSARAPKLDWIKQFIDTCKPCHRALHLCGQGLADFVEGKPETLALVDHFQRVQLNVRFENAGARLSMPQMMAHMAAKPQVTFIIQYADDQAHLLPMLNKIPNHVLLFDASAGRGLSPETWPAQIKSHTCGYAGGLGPDNVVDEIKKIADVAKGHETWIDMESKIRTNDVFDLVKVRKVLESVKGYF